MTSVGRIGSRAAPAVRPASSPSKRPAPTDSYSLLHPSHSAKDADVQTRLLQLSPLLRAGVGQRFDPSQVLVRFVSPEELYDRMMGDIAIRTQGVLSPPGSRPSKDTLDMLQGGYLPSERHLLISSRLRNTDLPLLVVLFHEGVHAAQHQNWPAFFTAVDEAATRAERTAHQFGPSSDEARNARAIQQARSDWTEGHAFLLQSAIAQGGLHGTPPSHLRAMKIIQILREHFPGSVETVFENPPLANALLQTHGVIELPASWQTSASDAILDMLNLALDCNPHFNEANTRWVDTMP